MLERNGVAYEYNISNHKFKTVFGDIKINLNGESEHAGSLVKSGEKWIATKWIRAQKWQ